MYYAHFLHISQHRVIFFFKKKITLTNRVMSGSCLCQHMKQRGVVGKGCYIQGNQALVTHPVHPLLPLCFPVFLFLLSSLPHACSSCSTSTVGVVSGQQALHSQSVLIFYCLPKGLVLMGTRNESAGPGVEVGLGERERKRVHNRRAGFLWGRGKGDVVQGNALDEIKMLDM